jgi:uncharacterized protein with ParB-like and HNH nuclease domain
MEASPSQIINFFNGFKQSVIPLFQRPYEWGEREWSALWDDIAERYEAEKELSHFMGAIVSMPAKSVPVGVSKYLIIDGQQRLTTIALLLCALRDELPEEAKPQRNRIQRHYLLNDGYDGIDHFKLLPTQGDRDAFKALVFTEGDAGSSKMRGAYEFFRKKISSPNDEGERIDPVQLLDVIERRLMVVSINLSDSDDPYLIFESLNHKGASLTQADLVRNYFLMRFRLSDQQRVYDDTWMPMQRRLDEHLTEFIRVYLMREGSEVLKGDIYSVLKKQLEARESEDVESELKRMNRLSEHYLRLLHPEKEEHDELRSRLLRLRRLEMATSHPLLLRVYDAYGRNEVTAEEFCSILQTIESFGVRRLLCVVATNQLKKIFLHLAKGLPSANAASWLTSELLPGAAGRRWPKDEEFQEAWMRGHMYSRKVCRLIIESLEEAHDHKEQASFAQATIEHVLPQTMTDAWREALGPEAEALHERLCDTIGNLTLSAYNSNLSNLPFPHKKKLLTESNYVLNRYFTPLDTWNANAIEERAAALWELAKEIWPRPNS